MSYFRTKNYLILGGYHQSKRGKTSIIVDESDIVKTKAKKMEGLKIVRDGSTATYKNAYDLINVIACKEQQDGCRIMLLSSDLVVSNENSDSVIQLTQDRLIDIILATGNKGVFMFDRGYDRKIVYSFLKDNECDFIVRAKGNRNLILNGVEQKFNDVAMKVKLNKKLVSKDDKHSFLCGIKRVKIRLNDHPVKYPDTADAWLVVARYQSGIKRRKRIFLFSMRFSQSGSGRRYDHGKGLKDVSAALENRRSVQTC